MTYKFVKELGQGSYGKVSLVKRGNSFFAQKVITDNIDLLVGVREMNITRMASKLNPHIINIEDHEFTTSGHSYQMTQYLEYCSGGCLDVALDEERDYPTREINSMLGNVTKRITDLANIASALNSLHINGIYHMDVKTENILYRKNNMCLCDFSNCIINNEWKGNNDPPKNQYQSLIYRSPDIATFRVSWKSARSSDVWAFAIVMLEALGLSGVIQDLENETDRQMSKIKNIVNRFVISDSRVKSKGVTNNNIFSKIFPTGNSGWGIEQSSSNNYGYLWCLLLANKIAEMDFNYMFDQSVQYFNIRKCNIGEQELYSLKRIITVIIPTMLVPNPDKRINMEDVCRELGSTVYQIKMPSTKVPPFDNIKWVSVVNDTKEKLSTLTATYGQETISISEDVFKYARTIAEATLINLKLSDTDITDTYTKLYGASFLLACELFDLMIDLVGENELIQGEMSLNDLSHHLVEITNHTAGTLLTISP